VEADPLVELLGEMASSQILDPDSIESPIWQPYQAQVESLGYLSFELASTQTRDHDSVELAIQEQRCMSWVELWILPVAPLDFDHLLHRVSIDHTAANAVSELVVSKLPYPG
ncbi:MAG: hypothetical protein Q9183_001288, partial [Haloplaca sp. 2 TL-2023]